MNNKTPNDPINKKHEVEESKDPHIDQDFENFPHAPAKEELINPKTKEDKLTARTIKSAPDSTTNEIQSDGSGGAFEATERTENDDEDSFRIDEK